jgi:uncharacterized membrane protein
VTTRSTWLLRLGTALLVLGFAFVLQGIWVALTRDFDMTPFDRAKMTAAVGFAVLVVGWILQRRGK